MIISRTEKHLISSTHVDKQNQAFSKEALEGMVQQSSERVIPLIYEHDPFCPPLGRVANASIEELDDSHYGLFADWLFYDRSSYGNIPQISINGKIDESGFIDDENRRIEVCFNPFILSTSSMEKIRDLFDEEVEIKNNVEKSATVIVVVITFVITHVLGKFFDGFVKGIGLDFEKYAENLVIHLKTKLINATKYAVEILRQKKEEFQSAKICIEFDFTYKTCFMKGLVDVSNDTNEDIYKTINLALNEIAGLVFSASIIYQTFPDLQHCSFVYNSNINEWSVIYVLEKDGTVSLGTYGREYLSSIRI